MAKDPDDPQKIIDGIEAQLEEQINAQQKTLKNTIRDLQKKAVNLAAGLNIATSGSIEGPTARQLQKIRAINTELSLLYER